MKHPNAILGLVRVFAIVGALSVLPAQPIDREAVAIPPALDVPAGNHAYLRAAAAGTQNYLCMPSGWTFIGPQATLSVALPSIRQQVATHFTSPNPDEAGTARATWQSSFDSSAVWAKPVPDATYQPDPMAVPWLKLEAVGARRGPTGGSAVSETTYIQRVNTTGGMMPATACTVGMRAFVPYTAEYVFYRKTGN